MTLEREVLISALRMTKDGCARIEDISLDARVPVQIVYRLARRYAKRETLNLEGKTLTMNGHQRLKAAVHAVELGADLERVCDLLGWNEFEDFSALALENNGFSVTKHFRFKHLEKRWEIDIVASKSPIVASVDCKHWHRGWRRSSIAKTAEEQVKRTQSLADASSALREDFGISSWKEARFIPIILSLVPSDIKLYEHIPIVPILQLRNFLEELPAYIESLRHFARKF